MKRLVIISNKAFLKAALVLAFASLTCSSYAQSNCNELTLSNAYENYNDGKFDEVIALITPCLPYFRSDDEKFSGHKLLAKTYIASDYFDKAKEQVGEMLKYRPDYQASTSEETQTFVEIVAEAKKAYAKENISDILVTTATKRAQLASDAPATIYVRTREQILKRGYRNLMELLEDIPEVEIQKNSISEFKNIVTFRGIAGNEKFIIMMDGIRITPVTGDPYTLGTNYSLVNAKRVEVILGPASSLYGLDAFSGIINIITLDAADVKGGIVNAGYGRYNTADNSLILGVQTKDIGFTITGQQYYSKEADLYNIYKNEFSWYNEKYVPEGVMDFNGTEKQVNTSPEERKLEMPTSSYFVSSKISFGNFEVGMSRLNERHSSSINVDPQYTLYTKEAFISTTLQSVYAKHIYKSKNDRWSLQSYLSSINFEMDPESKFINRYTEYTKGFKYQFGKSQKIEEQLEYDLSKKSSLIVGVLFEDLSALPKTADLPTSYNSRISADDQDIYYLNTNITDSAGRSLKILQDFHYLNYQNYGTFAQFHSKAIKYTELTLGGRFDYSTRFGGVFSPRLGVVIKPTSKIKLKLLYGRSFLAPSPWKAYSTFGSFEPVVISGKVAGLESPFFHIPNTNLKPERLTSTEAGISVFPTKNLFISIEAYYNQIRDLINIQAGVGAGTFKDVKVAYLEKAINEGYAHTHGGTVNATYTLQAGKSLVNLSAAYSYTDGDIEGKALVLAAKHTIKSVIDWSYDRLSVSLRLIYRTKSNSVVLDHQQQYLTNKPFALVNFFTRYQLIERENFSLGLSLRVNNLTNLHYYNVAGGQDSFYATPQDPARVDAGLSLTIK